MISKFIIIGWTLFIGWAFLSGINDAAQVTDTESVAFNIAIFGGLIFYFFLWALVAMPTYMISRMFARKRTLEYELDPTDETVYQPRKRVARPH